jgi:hypothetical protein
VRKEAIDTNKPVMERANFLLAYVRNEGRPLIQVRVFGPNKIGWLHQG